MVKKKLFIMTHLGSGWEKLAAALEQNSRFQVFETGQSYHHPEDTKLLESQIHRVDNAVSVWVDVVLHNKDFTMKRLWNYYRFIFWSCPFEECQESLRLRFGDRAESYWHIRMRGLREYHRRCVGSLWNPVLEQNLLLKSVL